MVVLVIDGQGGRLGSLLVTNIRKNFPKARILAVGTNSIATATMLKAGADEGATGSNPVIVGARKADIIIGPIGMVIADSLLGEVTAEMAVAVAQSSAARVMIPMNRCDNLVAGVTAQSLNELVEDAMEKVKRAKEEHCCI